jgi:hypothetical protein
MRGRITLLLLGLTLTLFVGTASANDEVEDTINAIDEIQTATELFNATIENSKDLDRLMEDPTNESLVGESIENTVKRTVKPLIGDVDNPQDVEDTMMRWIYSAFIMAIFNSVILPIFAMLH